MKAKDYYEKYKESVKYYEANEDDELKEMCRCMLIDMSTEVEALKNERHVSTMPGLVSILKEQNLKWNAMVNIFIKNHGFSPFQINAYQNVLISKMPELEKLL